MRNLPNILTLCRLALAPAAVLAILAGRYRQALGVFLAAAITDGMDGYLARRLNAMTRFGAYMDPLADKVLLSAAYLGLGVAGAAPWWFVGLVFGRDLLILAMAGAALLFTRYRDFPPSVWGKVSTFCQVGAALALIVARAFPSLDIRTGAALWIAAAATAWSGAHYVLRGARMARNARRAASGLTAQ